MANYFVGDIQGCYQELQRLLAQVDFHPSRDQLWAVGDLLARGEGSLEVLRFFKQHDGATHTVLGNHELNFFAVHAGMKRNNPKDKLETLIDASDCQVLVDFLREQPLYHFIAASEQHSSILMTHAGVPPQWNLSALQQAADAVQQRLLRADFIDTFISKMYGDSLDSWQVAQTSLEQDIYTVNALTRMRYLHEDGRLDFQCKLAPSEAPKNLQPWFLYPSALESDIQIVFGHWAALMGECPLPHIHALDTGCVWGESLTLWHLESNELLQQPALNQAG